MPRMIDRVSLTRAMEVKEDGGQRAFTSHTYWSLLGVPTASFAQKAGGGGGGRRTQYEAIGCRCV